VLYCGEKGGEEMFKVTDKMKHLGSIRGGWDFYEDEDFLYLLDGNRLVASFSVFIDPDLLRRALTTLEYYFNLDRKSL
jgi:hypothetical protein